MSDMRELWLLPATNKVARPRDWHGSLGDPITVYHKLFKFWRTRDAGNLRRGALGAGITGKGEQGGRTESGDQEGTIRFHFLRSFFCLWRVTRLV